MNSGHLDLHFSGHETFPLRHTWLPKAVRLVKQKPESLAQEYEIMQELGVGKNMAKAVRHWVESAQIASRKKAKDYSVTHVGETLFSSDGDEYLEKKDSIWLLHYLICSNPKKNALWYYLFNYFTGDVILPDEFLELVKRWGRKFTQKLPSEHTLRKDFECCMNMYSTPDISDDTKDVQSILASPLRDLRLIYDQRDSKNYVLRTVDSKELSPHLLTYCIIDYLEKKDFPSSVTVDEILLEAESPGRLFRLTESIVVEYLLDFERLTNKKYFYDSTAGLKQLLKNRGGGFDKEVWLKKVYK